MLLKSDLNQVAKAVATSKWKPSKPKSDAQAPTFGEEEIFPLATTEASGMETKQAAKSVVYSKKVVSWDELRTGMGQPDDQMNLTPVSEKPPTPQLFEDESDQKLSDDALVLNYLTAEGSLSKWKKKDPSSSPQLKFDSETKTAYCYDEKHGYQVH